MARKINCREAGFDCDFEVQSESEDEVIEFAQTPARRTHEKDLSRSDIRGYLQDA